jgi:hypothetical protein
LLSVMFIRVQNNSTQTVQFNSSDYMFSHKNGCVKKEGSIRELCIYCVMLS